MATVITLNLVMRFHGRKRTHAAKRLSVTYRDDDTVAWQTWKRDGWMSDNAWTLRGWTEVVCNRSNAVKVADA